MLPRKAAIFSCSSAQRFLGLPYFLHFSYGVYGVLTVLCFYLFQKYRGIDAVAFAALTYGQYTPQDGNTTQRVTIAAAIPVLLYNGKRGALSLKYFFYISYHVYVIALRHPLCAQISIAI